MSEASSDRRNIDPTPHRLQEARRRGEIAVSVELSSTMAMAGGVAALAAFGPTGLRQLLELTQSTFDDLAGAHGQSGAAWALLFLMMTAPVALAGVLSHAATSALQLGFPPAFSPLRFAPEKVFGLKGLARLLDPKDAIWRTLKSVLKLVAVAAAAALALAPELDALHRLHTATVPGLSEVLDSVASRLAFAACLCLGGLGLLDYGVSRRRWWAKLKMTPEELKREIKEQEGDPEIRRRRKLRMKELARRRLETAVPKADVVVLNPTHYAVALRYRPEEGQAPRVLAKGRDEVARRIRALAREHGVPMVRKPSLARLLYRTVREGRSIPAETYRAVAEVLAYVYRLRGARP